jgi:hypothetical protein
LEALEWLTTTLTVNLPRAASCARALRDNFNASVTDPGVVTVRRPDATVIDLPAIFALAVALTLPAVLAATVKLTFPVAASRRRCVAVTARNEKTAATAAGSLSPDSPDRGPARPGAPLNRP